MVSKTSYILSDCETDMLRLLLNLHCKDYIYIMMDGVTRVAVLPAL